MTRIIIRPLGKTNVPFDDAMVLVFVALEKGEIIPIPNRYEKYTDCMFASIPKNGKLFCVSGLSNSYELMCSCDTEMYVPIDVEH